ncbi:GNAT family N-acetyltransferase [Candidatus Leptofilum sp.]|uniref:GNAT family N-acetyltransferase n=1 Tax=Candidatus Leptofilum sp. TaxID=3241576 RepID=UPI003B5AB177
MNSLPINLPEVEIRPFHPDDASQQYAIVSDPRVAEMLMQLPSMELAETEQWATTEKPGRHRLVADWNGRLLGAIHLSQNLRPRMQHSGRLGMMVHPDAWGHGVGGKLVAAALNLADNWLNLSRLELEVFSHNSVAIYLYEKFGFEKEGLRKKAVFGNGRFLDEFVMARLHGNFPGPAQPAAPAKPPPQADFTADEVIIRPMLVKDIDDLYACFRHPLVARTTLQMPSQEISATQKRVETQIKGLHRLVAEVEGKAVGSITLHQSNNPRTAHAAGLGMMVHPAYWGKGIGSQLMAAVIDLADNWLNISRIRLEVNVDNPAGVRLYHKFGFEIEGTKRWHAFGDGRLADSHFMARVR